MVLIACLLYSDVPANLCHAGSLNQGPEVQHIVHECSLHKQGTLTLCALKDKMRGPRTNTKPEMDASVNQFDSKYYDS